jgi:2-(3-amino-3-carboxypropyl)histidine synthase
MKNIIIIIEMENKTIQEIEEIYDLELEKVVKTIKQENAKKVLLQFPEGMKPYAQTIANEIETLTNNKCQCVIWMGTCFGACDLPMDTSRLGIDLAIQFGHSNWGFKKKDIKEL